MQMKSQKSHFVEMTYTAPYHFTNSDPKVRSFTCYVETSIFVLYGIYDHELKKDSVLERVFDISIWLKSLPFIKL